MKRVEYSQEKNQLLQLTRGISFEIILKKIEKKEILGRVKHPNQKKYPNQMIFLFEIEGYIYYVPYVEDEEKIFFKTIIPSRKLTKEFRSQNEKK